MRRSSLFIVLLCCGALAACNKPASDGSVDTKKDLDALVQSTRSLNETLGGIATSAKATSDDVKALSGKVDGLQRAVTEALGRQKRAAFSLALDSDVACDNDSTCSDTARALCNKIGYPNAMTSKYTPGIRPMLHAMVCFD